PRLISVSFSGQEQAASAIINTRRAKPGCLRTCAAMREKSGIKVRTKKLSPSHLRWCSRGELRRTGRDDRLGIQWPGQMLRTERLVFFFAYGPPKSNRGIRSGRSKGHPR